MLVLLFMVGLIIFQLRKKNESQKSILMKILTNYLQVLTVTLSMDLEYPESLNDIFYPAEKVGNPSTPFVSFDCFVRDRELTLFAPSAPFLEDFLSAMIPPVAAILTCIFYGTMRLFPFNWAKELKRNIVVTNVVILFVLHPNITQNSIDMFE